MADKEKVNPKDELVDTKKPAKAEAEGGEEASPPKKGLSPLVLIISAVVSLIAFVGVFSYTMGVFDPAPPPAEESASQAGGEAHRDSLSMEGDEYQSEYGRAAAEVEKSMHPDAVDTLGELSLLDRRRREIEQEEDRIAQERRELTQLKGEVERLLSKKDAIADEKVLYMAKLIDGMKPEEFSGLITELDNGIILKVLPKMKPQNASQLLAQLPAKRAAAIATALLESEEAMGK